MESSWSAIVSKGQALKLPRNFAERPNRAITEVTTLFTAADLSNRLRIHRAEALLQRPLHADTLLFELPSLGFEEQEDVFKTLNLQFKSTLGARIIQAPNGRQNGKLLVEARFEKDDEINQALNDGMTIDGIQHRAIRTKNEKGDLPKMVRVHMTGIPFEATTDLETKIKESMQQYGLVCQIKTLKQHNIFIGAVSVLLDIDTNLGTFEPLQRMLYLDQWGIYVPATFKGAPPVCYHCRQSGHLKRDCPVLAAVLCFKCRGRGHIARHCYQATVPTVRELEIEKDSESVDDQIQKKTKKQ